MSGRFPDFLGIGTTRGGSSWLYRVLSRHPDVWMPPVKEVHYFDRPRDGRRTIGFARRELLIRGRDYPIGERKRSTGDSLWQIMRKAESVARSRRSDYAGNIRRWRAAIGEEQLFIGYANDWLDDARRYLDSPAPPR
ncbi:MAG: hypothetical protein EA384_09570 [Spirochaetaceae bacterium]|nr:MAG: hypothetical protein EA384_09570 [Spirochaetaceae bacterium]